MPPRYNDDGEKIVHLNYNKIEQNIYIGTTFCCRYHFEKLLSLGIKADVDLQEEKMDNPSGVTSFLWLPTTDFTPPSQAQLTIGAHFIEDLVNNKMSCYVHCNEGYGRAPTLVASYYILAKGMTPREAVKFIKNRRRKADPNKEQMQALNRFYKRLHP